MSISACSQAIGITPETWRNWSALGYQGKEPYARFFIKIQEAEASLQKECLDAVRTSIKLGNVETAKWLLERKYSSEFGKTSSIKVDQKTESVNLNIQTEVPVDERRTCIMRVLDKLQPKNSHYPQLE